MTTEEKLELLQTAYREAVSPDHLADLAERITALQASN